MKTRAGRLPAAALAVGVAFLCVATAVAAWQVHAARQEQGDAFAALAKEVTPVYRHCLLTFSGGAVLRDIPLAETKVQQDKGLSGRNDVEPEMLFTFPKPDRLMFWMRDTQVPLSVGFSIQSGGCSRLKTCRPIPTISISPCPTQPMPWNSHKDAFTWSVSLSVPD